MSGSSVARPTNPPTIVLVVNDPQLFTQNYERFLMNRFREELPYDEVPIRLIMRSRSRVEKRAKDACLSHPSSSMRSHCRPLEPLCLSSMTGSWNWLAMRCGRGEWKLCGKRWRDL